VAQSRRSFYNKGRICIPKRVARSRWRVAVRPPARIKEAHEVEQDWPDIEGLRSIHGGSAGHVGVRWLHGRFHVGSGHAI
jgi:hypothetical protein